MLVATVAIRRVNKRVHGLFLQHFVSALFKRLLYPVRHGLKQHVVPALCLVLRQHRGVFLMQRPHAREVFAALVAAVQRVST